MLAKIEALEYILSKLKLQYEQLQGEPKKLEVLGIVRSARKACQEGRKVFTEMRGELQNLKQSKGVKEFYVKKAFRGTQDEIRPSA